MENMESTKEFDFEDILKKHEHDDFYNVYPDQEEFGDLSHKEYVAFQKLSIAADRLHIISEYQEEECEEAKEIFNDVVALNVNGYVLWYFYVSYFKREIEPEDLVFHLLNLQLVEVRLLTEWIENKTYELYDVVSKYYKKSIAEEKNLSNYYKDEYIKMQEKLLAFERMVKKGIL